MKLLYIEEHLFCTKTELLNFKMVLPLVKLHMVSSRLALNGLIPSDDILVDIQLVTFLLLSNISGAKAKKPPPKYILPNKKIVPFF